MRLLSLWIFGSLFITFSGAHGLNQFPENFVVAKRNNGVTLNCNADPDAVVNWNFTVEGEAESIASYQNVQQVGQNLNISNIDAPNVGEYRCWSGRKMLSSVHLLLQANEEDSLFHCWAKSYYCNFSCIWKNTEYTAVRVRLSQNCAEEGDSCPWVTQTDPLPDVGFQFNLSHSLSPYAEENTMLELTVEATDYFTFLRKTKRFYLRDIIQPDSPQIVQYKVVMQNLDVTIAPPSSWPAPHSFFSLEHELEYMLKDNGQVENSTSTLIPKRISKLRVRSRDSLVRSNWSQWTDWKNVKTRGRKRTKAKKQ